MKEYLIIGNGVAAAGCIEGIRSVDGAGRITVVSGEKRAVYCRPLISYYLQGKTDLSRMAYRPGDFYEAMGCAVLSGRAVAAMDCRRHSAALDNGGELCYDKACIATGSSPFVPAFKGLETVEKQFSFMTVDDALALERELKPDSRVLIMGAGMIGLKCAEGIRGRVASVTVCDLAGHILSSVMDEQCADPLQDRLRENGVELVLGQSVSEFDGHSARLSGGGETGFDLLVLAVGIRPNTALLADIDGCVGRGITVDERLQTKATDVYAAGDCTECYDLTSGTVRPLANLPNAYMQGYTAGVNMAGGEAEFQNPIPMNSIGFYGLHAMTAGSSFGTGEGEEVYEDSAPGRFKRLVAKDGYLAGFALVGDVGRAGIYTALIRDRVPLDSIDFELIKKSPSLLPFGRDFRGQKLGGVV